MFEQTMFGLVGTMTTATANIPQPALTHDGFLYQLAVFNQALEEEPVATAFRAEPGTLARLWHKLRHHVPAQSASLFVPYGPGYFGGIRLEEDNELPPRPPGRVDMIDHKGRIMGIIDLPT